MPLTLTKQICNRCIDKNEKYQPARAQVQWQFSAAQLWYQDRVVSFQEQKGQAYLAGHGIY